MPPTASGSLIARAAGGAAVVLGLLALGGWILGLPWLKSVLPGAVEMKVNTALGLVLAGSALLIWSTPGRSSLGGLARAMALLVAALGLATLGQYVFGWELGIDELLFRDTGRAYTAAPGRMSPYSAVAFTAAGIALLALPHAGLRGLVWPLSALVAGIGGTGVLGYVWGATELTTDAFLPPLALHSAFAFLLLGIGMLVASDHWHLAGADGGVTRVSVEFKVAGGFIAAFVLLIVGGGITYRSGAHSAASERQVARSQDVRARLSQVYVAVSEAESAMRAFLLTGDEDQRKYFAHFAQQARHNAEVLRDVADDDAAHRQLLQRLDAVLDERLTVLENAASLYRETGPDKALVLAAIEKGTRLMATLRELTQEIDSVERELQGQRAARAVSDRQNSLLFLTLTLVGAAGIFLMLLRSIRREMLARAESEERARSLNADLERRVAERTAALEANRRHFVDLFEFAPDALVMTDREGTIVQVNRRAEALFGWERSELVGRPAQMLMPAEDVAAYASLGRRFLHPSTPAKQGSATSSLRAVHRDGRVFPVDVSVDPLRSEGGEMFVAAVRDTTEREQMNEALRRSEEEIRAINADLERRVAERTAELGEARKAAEEASRAKSAFLATMSHEIRTPMNGVIGMVEVLSRSALPEPQADAVRTIRASAFSLLRLIDDILDFSKIEAGRLELERAPVALPELVEDVCKSLSSVALDKDVELTLFVHPRVPEHVWSDATRLRQVLYNLAGNAIKFSAGNPARRGKVSLRVDVDDEAQRQLVLRVADNGIGMAPETLDKLFSSFTQAEVSTTRRFGGTGLGLAIVKRLLTLMGGDVAVQSRLDEGSIFTVTLPIEEVQGHARRPLPDLTGLHCLVVGSGVQADDVRIYLEDAGARAHVVPNVHAAAYQASGLGRPVVIHSSRQGVSADTLQATFAGSPDARHLVIARGRRRGARTDARDAISLEGNCLRRSSLLSAVAVAAGRAAPDTFRDSEADDLVAEAVTPPSVGEARARNRLILVAEDDEINQKVILRQMDMLGYATEIASDGAEALRLWRAGRYALLLSDLHMPEMDGYALAQAIREEEARRGVPHAERLPILALTANALRGEALRATEAGMDDYLTKPLALPLLKAALRKWLPDEPPETSFGALAETPPAAPAVPVLDVAVLRGIVGEDAEVVREFLSDYRTSAQQLAAEIRSAWAAQDFRRIGASAHRLKSSSRSVGALALGDVCAELENASRAGTRVPIMQNLERFETELAAVDAAIASLLADG